MASIQGIGAGGQDAAAHDPRIAPVAFALYLADNADAIAAIADARRTGQPWSATRANLTAALTQDGYNLVVSGAGRPIRVRLPDAQPIETGRAMLGGDTGPDDLTQRLFVGPILLDPASRPAILRGEEFTVAQATMLAGAPAGSTLRIMDGLAGSTVTLTVRHPTLVPQQNRVVLRSTMDGVKTVKMEEFFLANSAPAGTGLRAFARMAQAAQEAGFQAIETVAVGNLLDPKNGYYTWPRFGFNGVLSARQAEWAGTTDLLTLMETPEGRDLWRLNGCVVEARFDLEPGSRSQQALARYMAEKGARI